MVIQMKEQFPANRRQNSKRQAQARIHDALVNMGREGHGLHGLRYRNEGQQADYPLWIHGLGRFAAQVKGGSL